MRTILKRVGVVILVGLAAWLPWASIRFWPMLHDAPFWYSVLYVMGAALGASWVPTLVGALIVIAARGSPGGGLRAALITVVALSSVLSILMLLRVPAAV